MEPTREGTKACPFCGEDIRLSAVKCRFCNEMLTGLRPGDQVVSRAAVQDRTPKPRVSAVRRVVGILVLTFLVFILYKTLTNDPRAPLTDPGEAIRQAIAKPHVIVDEEIAVSADGWQARTFTLTSPRPIQVVAQGMKDTDKGFTVYVMETSELTKLREHESFTHIPALHGLTVRSFSNTATLPPGQWAVVVVNSENILNTMIVRLRVVSDPES